MLEVIRPLVQHLVSYPLTIGIHSSTDHQLVVLDKTGGIMELRDASGNSFGFCSRFGLTSDLEEAEILKGVFNYRWHQPLVTDQYLRVHHL